MDEFSSLARHCTLQLGIRVDNIIGTQRMVGKLGNYSTAILAAPLFIRKAGYPSIMIPIIKITLFHNHLVFIMGITIHVKRVFILRGTPAGCDFGR